MNTQPVIMVQIADRAWTRKVLHDACLMARQEAATIALIQMIPVNHPSYLGTELGYMNFSEADRSNLAEYQATLEDYGVEFSVHLFQYATLADAIIQAAEAVDARFVFATLPKSILPWWRSFQLRSITRQMAHQQRLLIIPPQLRADLYVRTSWNCISRIMADQPCNL